MPLPVALPFKSARSEGTHPLPMPATIIPLMRTLLCVSLLACAAGCGGEAKSDAEGGAAGGAKETPSGQPATPAKQAPSGQPPTPAEKAHSGQPATPAEEAPLDQPATPAEAAKFLDLSTFPLMPGVPESTGRSVARLAYRVKDGVGPCVEFQKKNLEALGWKQMPGGAVTDAYASTNFTRAGFHVSVMVSQTEPGTVDVILQNGGNVDLAKLPLPPGTKPLYVGPLNATHTTEAPAAAMAEECRKLLTAAGWQACGGSGEQTIYKQNGVLLRANVSTPPGQKTMITYSSELLSADITAMPDAEGLRYSDSRLDFDTPSTEEAVSKFYRDALGGSGWVATMDHILKLEHKGVVIFRNPAKEMLTLELQRIPDKNQTRVALLHQSTAAMAEEDRQDKAMVEKAKQKLKADLEKTVLVVPLPADAAVISETKNEIKLTVSAGSAASLLKSLDKLYGETGWLMSDTRQGGVGVHGFKREGQTVTINFSDTGAGPAEMTITSTGIGLEVAKATKPIVRKVAVVLPAGAAGVEHRGSQMKFTVSTGKAKATVEAMQKQFLDAGWKLLAASLDGDYGNASLTKDGMRLSINYVDTGPPSARIEMAAVGAEFERPGGQ